MSGFKYAFSLSKAEVLDAKPPGTVQLSSNEEGHHRILRWPIASSDPADPLNWPMWRKNTITIVGAYYSFIANYTSSMVSAALPVWYSTFPSRDPRPYSDLTRFISINILLLGIGSILWVPLANVIGRRPVLIMASLMTVLATLWGGLATSYSSVLGARAIQGLGCSAADTVVPSLIGDVYFLDERGRAMAIYTVFLTAGSLVGGIAGNYIAAQLGWVYLWWIDIAFAGALLLAMMFLIPETLYDRDLSAPPLEGTDYDEKEVDECVENAGLGPTYRPFTFIRSLGFRKPTSNIFAQLVALARTLLLPGTLVVMLHSAGFVGGIIAMSTVGPQLVAAAPYNWTTNSSLINIGPLLGTILGGVYTYLVADAQLKSRATKDSHGYSEAEDRLPVMFPALVIGTAGFFIFGFCAQYPAAGRWVGMQFGFGMLSFGLMQVPSIGYNYLIDSYSFMAADCFVTVSVFRGVISFAYSYFISDWVTKDGPAEAFGIFGMLMGLFALLTVPLWLYGKRLRIATSGVLARASNSN